MKMKLSVIIGVLHMSMGVVTKGLNALYMKNNMVFWTEVVTGMIILNGLFGWMDLLIVIKWLYPMNPYSMYPPMQNKINQCPSIITIMINNFLLMGKQPFALPDGTEKEVYLFDGQRAVSETLVVLVIICMPIMLFVKPCSACFCPEAAGMPEYAEHHQQLESGPVVN